MGKTFDIWKRKFRDAAGQVVEKFYACPKTFMVFDEDDLAEEISQRCSLTQGDVVGAVSALSEIIKEKLMMGASVKIKGIGTFGVWVTSDGFDDPKDITAKKVKATKVTYKADRKLTQAIREMKFETMPTIPKGFIGKRVSK
ncbi:MAG: HU family DNA-binding protein [Bacteroidales bacterium]|nr:HU family DNA-binding protein [Bacteroidales bacterium]MDD4684588.1 HU family DNA-binding protein [Bacteroidales bacterium]